MKQLNYYFLILSLCLSFYSNAQSNCESNLKAAKNALLAMAGGDQSKNTSDFMVATVVGLAGGCLNEYNQFNVFQQDVRKRLARGEKFNKTGFTAPADSYKMLEERQKNMDAFKAETERTFGSSYSQPRTRNYNSSQSNSGSNNSSYSRGDKTLELLKSVGAELEKSNNTQRDRKALENIVTDPSKIGQTSTQRKADQKAPAGYYNKDGQVRSRQ